jgi:hypothetical protein
MWDSKLNGLFINPEKIRLALAIDLEKEEKSVLLHAVIEYEEWLKSSDTSLLKGTVCQNLWKKYENSNSSEIIGFVKEFDERLIIYDAVCREIARRWAIKNLCNH